MRINQEKKIQDESKPVEEITMNVIKEIANSLDDMIKFEVDYPEKNKSGKIPILDIEASINKSKQNKLEFEFYEKPTKNKFVMLSDSAIPSKQKRTILTQECLRRLRNTQIDLGKEVQTKHLNKFMIKMKNSGHSEQYRKQILDSTLKAFDEMIEADHSGERPLYRSKNWQKEIRKEKKKNNHLNWYKTGGSYPNAEEYKTVLIVPVTKDGILAKEVRQREFEINKNGNTRVKVVEDGGVQLKNFLVKKDPFPTLKCETNKCFICKSEKSENLRFACNSDNVGYQLQCDTCFERGITRVYEGESSRSARIRGSEHLSDLKYQRSSSVLYKHKEKEHNGEKMEISMKIINKFKDPLTRQANEAVRIGRRNEKKGELLNSKNEFHHPKIARIIVEKNNGYKVNQQGKSFLKPI